MPKRYLHLPTYISKSWFIQSCAPKSVKSLTKGYKTVQSLDTLPTKLILGGLGAALIMAEGFRVHGPWFESTTESTVSTSHQIKFTERGKAHVNGEWSEKTTLPHATYQWKVASTGRSRSSSFTSQVDYVTLTYQEQTVLEFTSFNYFSPTSVGSYFGQNIIVTLKYLKDIFQLLQCNQKYATVKTFKLYLFSVNKFPLLYWS